MKLNDADVTSNKYARFQTTYEELKLDQLHYYNFYVDGFQTTYEELKLPDEILYGLASFSFQTTYEELKLQKDTIAWAGSQKLPDYL